MRDLIFHCLEDNSDGILSAEDLGFFYYDIGIDVLTGYPSVYVKDNRINDFMDKRNLTIEAVERDAIPNVFEANKIFFVKGENDSSNEDAFFRHLRNAFAHYHITRKNDFFYMKDYFSNHNRQVSMIGMIKCVDLKKLCFMYFDQREQLESSLSVNHYTENNL